MCSFVAKRERPKEGSSVGAGAQRVMEAGGITVCCREKRSLGRDGVEVPGGGAGTPAARAVRLVHDVPSVSIGANILPDEPQP